MTSGCFDLCQFPQPPAGEHRCPVDGGVIRDAVKSTRCGHVYGMQCILTHLLKKKEACPVCSLPMDVSHLQPAETLRRRILSLPMACRELDKCSWVGTVQEEPEHVHGPYCGVYMIQCPFCEVRVREADFEAHKTVCPEAIVVCEQCYEDMPRKEMAMHEKGLGGRICRLTTPMKRQKEAAMAQVKARQEAAEKKAKLQQEHERTERMSFHQSMCGNAAADAGGQTPEPHERVPSAKGGRPPQTELPSIILDDASPISEPVNTTASPEASRKAHDTTTRVYATVNEDVPSTDRPKSVDTTANGGEGKGSAAVPPNQRSGTAAGAATSADEGTKDAQQAASVDPEEDPALTDPAVFFGQLPATVDSLQAALFDLTQRHEELERRHYHLQHTVFDLIDYISSRDMSSNNNNTTNSANNASASTTHPASTDAATKPQQGYKSVKPLFGGSTSTATGAAPSGATTSSSSSYAKKAAFDYVFSTLHGANNKTAGQSNITTPQKQLFTRRDGQSPPPSRPQHLPPMSEAAAQQQPRQRPVTSPLSTAKLSSTSSNTQAHANGSAKSGAFTERSTRNSGLTSTAAAASAAPSTAIKPKAPSAPPTASDGAIYRRASVSVASSAASTAPSSTNGSPEMTQASKPSSSQPPAAVAISVSASTPMSAKKSTKPAATGLKLQTNSANGSLSASSSLFRSSVTVAGHTPSPSSAASPIPSKKTVLTAESGKSPIQYTHRVGQGKGLKGASPAKK